MTDRAGSCCGAGRVPRMVVLASLIGLAALYSSAVMAAPGEPLSTETRSGNIGAPVNSPYVDSRARVQASSPFTDSEVLLPGAIRGAAAWGDYDSDGDLDILLTGLSGSGAIGRVYRNDGGSVFSDIGAPLPGTDYGAAAWGDYDNDGDLDIALEGDTGSGDVTAVYRNDGSGLFTNTGAGLLPVRWGTVSWADYDGDGDLDLLISGEAADVPCTRLYRNDGGDVFTDSGITLPQVYAGAAAWADYDNDGDQDLLLAGFDSVSAVTRIYRNDRNGVFTDLNAGLQPVILAAAAWGDYDADGALDLVVSGMYSYPSGFSTTVYHNTGSGFAAVPANLPGAQMSAAAWGDYDADGDIDLLLAGYDLVESFARIYRNDGAGVFTNVQAGLVGTHGGTAAWGDFDNDGRPDVLLEGMTTAGAATKLYRNLSPAANQPPAAPVGLQATAAESSVTLGWNPAHDPQTPAAGLGYNLRVGINPGGNQIVTSMADSGSGYRRLPALGNVGRVLTATLSGLATNTTYYWSVQAIDGAWAGSPFAAEGSFQTGILADAGAGLTGVYLSAAAFGDYDGDGDLDILLAGNDVSSRVSKVYRNDGPGAFTDIGAALPAVDFGRAAWGDFDGDGDLDIVLTGDTGHGYLAAVYRNDGAGGFTDIDAGLLPVRDGSVAWGDYDNDGDLDLLLTGDTGTNTPATRLYENRGAGSFVDSGIVLAPVFTGAAAWGDFDDDADLDLLLTGHNGGAAVTNLYRNDGGGVFTSLPGLLPVAFSAAAWGDYDSDGHLDLVVTGAVSLTQAYAVLYHNNGAGGFTPLTDTLPGVAQPAVAWGDYDNDGDLDLLLAGNPLSGALTRVYRNDGGVLVDAQAGLEGTFAGAAAWGDYDNDGRLDLLVSGADPPRGIATARLYRNQLPAVNQPPAVPSGLVAAVFGTSATLTWNPSGDPQTATPGLTYNVRVGTVPGGSQIVSPMARAGDGRRHLPSLGNAQLGTNFLLRGLVPGIRYYWAVQAVDGAWSGSPFVAESSFLVPVYAYLPVIRRPLAAPVLMQIDNPSGAGSYTVTWNAVPGATNYSLQEARDGTYTSVLAAYTGPNTHYAATQRGAGRYLYRVAASNPASGPGPWSNSSVTDVLWEAEPNNTWQQANGPLISGLNYHGYPDDQRDYFSLYVPSAGIITVDLSNPTAEGTQLLLYYQTVEAGFEVARSWGPEYHLQHTGAAGWYWIYIYAVSGTGGTPYTLRVTYP